MALVISCLRYNHSRHRQALSHLYTRYSSKDTTGSDKHILLEHRHKSDHDDTTSDPPFISVLTLNRPKANAMGRQMLKELSEAIDCLESSNSRCVVIASHSPKVFSAGADLKERSGMTLAEAEAFVTRLRHTFHRFSQLPMPTIAAMEGVAVGGGLELALACDLRVASHQSTLGLVETSLAILPGAGGTQRLTRLVGLARAKQMILTAERVDGATAKEYGLVQNLVEPGQCLDYSLDLAWKIAGNGPIAIRAAKQAMDQGLFASTMEEALEIERTYYGKTLPTEDRLEGLAAFKEGRSPNYKGR